MGEEQVREYLRAGRLAQLTDETMRSNLLAAGWNAQLVDQVFAEGHTITPVTPPKAVLTPEPVSVHAVARKFFPAAVVLSKEELEVGRKRGKSGAHPDAEALRVANQLFLKRVVVIGALIIVALFGIYLGFMAYM